MGGKKKKQRNESAMADEEETTAVSSPPSPFHQNASSPFSSSFRFIRFADHSHPSPTPNNHFELEECDVLWPPELSSGGEKSPISVSGDRESGLRRPYFPTERFGLSAALAEEIGPSEMSKMMLHQSAPVNVPAWPKVMRKAVGGLVEAGDGEEEEEEMLPPHLIVARSHAMKFSVVEGVGRTLKGRDLWRVRNAVFQKTGFLD